MAGRIRQTLATRFGPESKTWIRVVDALMVLSLPLALAVAWFLFRVRPEPPLLQAAFAGTVVSAPVVAYCLYRESDLTRIERIAILALVLCLGFALLVATLEAGQKP